MLRASRSGAERAAGNGGPQDERARSPVAPPPHLRAPAPAPVPRFPGPLTLLVGLVLLGLGLFLYGTVLPSQPNGASKGPPSLLPWRLLSNAWRLPAHQRRLRRVAHPLSVCDRVSAAPSAAAAVAPGAEGGASMTKESYSIWAQPKGPLADKLKAEVAHLAERYGGPVFPPHVTVLGDIERPREEVQALMKQLAAQVKKYRVNFTEVTRGTFYYQCVFLLAAKDEGTMAAAAAARNVYGMTTPPYMPHLSLLYADKEDEQKAQVVEYETARLYGESPGYDTLIATPGYDVDSLALWYTPTADKSSRSWCLVEEYPVSN